MPFQKGYIPTEEHRKRLAISKFGAKNPSKRTDVRKRIGVANKGKIPWNKGIPRTEEEKKKMSNTKKGRPNFKIRGSKHPHWRGGVTKEHVRIRNSGEYRSWRLAVLERDCNMCVFCSDVGNVADHIKPFYLFPELRLAIDNGRTLCVDCHKKTDTYGRKVLKIEY